MQQSDFKIYNASAGSGKTFTLAKSYIKILIKAKNYDQFRFILAITFTNKAVGEMKARIINMLTSFSSEDGLKNPHPMFIDICKELSVSSDYLHNKSKHILKHILHNYGAFDISTIDGFTHRVIRTFAHDLKLPVNFEVELDQERLLSEAVDSLIAKAGSDKKLTDILVDFAIEKADDDKSWDISYDFNKISKLLVNENDFTAIKTLKDKSLDDFKKLTIQIKKEIKSVEENIIKIANETLTLIISSGLEFSNFTRGTLPNHFIKASKLDFKDIYKNKLEENIDKQKGLYSNKLDAHLTTTIERILPNIETNYKTQKKLIFNYKFLKSAYKNITPLSVLHAIQEELNTIKEEQNKMLISEFNKIISKEIKNQPTPFIYERLGEKFKHYFLDEFQDTSKMQWENLVPLLDNALSSANGSTMLVGDAKQAIYRWRGGEAEQFINLYNKNENSFQIEAEVLTLDTNYRSAKEVISFNNGFFEFLSSQYLSDANYAALYKNATQNKSNETEGYVNLNFLDIKREDDSNQLYAEHVLATVKQCQNNGFNLDEICVIVRKRKEGVVIANYLSHNGIKITSSETLLLINSEKVAFLDSFLKLLLQPDNDSLKIKILSFLADLFDIEDKHLFFTTHLKDSLDAFFKSLERLQIFINKSKFLQLPLYELVEELIRTFKLNDTSDAYLQFYLDVVLEFTQKENSNLTAFVDYFEKKKDKLSVVSPEHISAVQIITIHKSKGLEFPVVIFPFADLNIYRELEPKVWFPVDPINYNNFNTLLLNYNKDIEQYGDLGLQIYNTHQSRLELDNINLLYVVLTRAIDQLYIISKKDISSNGTVNESTYAGMLISYLQHIGKWSENDSIYSFGTVKRNEKPSELKVISKSLQLISVPKEDHDLSILTKAGLLWDTKQEKAMERGNLVHLVLSKVKTIEDLNFAFNDLLVSGDVTKDNQKELKALVLEVTRHPQLEQYYKEGFDIYNERDIITSFGQLLRPDRLNINSNNEVVIIDYKTGDAKGFHAAQLKDYETVLSQMNFIVTYKILVYINDTIEVVEV